MSHAQSAISKSKPVSSWSESEDDCEINSNLEPVLNQKQVWEPLLYILTQIAI